MNAIRLLLCGLMLFSLSPAFAQRQERELAAGWKFVRSDVAPEADPQNWQTVSVPHTWNALDGQNGKAANPQDPSGYYRGPAWYARPLDIPKAWKSKRVFLHFEAASLVADVYVNGQKVGQHRGGFGAFCFEISSYLHFDGKDYLRVRVDNSNFQDIPPLSGDFTVFGGIYRPVHLFATDPVCISPLDFATDGVYLTPTSIQADKAQVEVKTLLSNGLSQAAGIKLETQVRDGRGQTILTQTQDVTLPSGQTEQRQTFSIVNPHLWRGQKTPYLYSVRVRVQRDNEWVDEITQPLGLRTVEISPEKGFLLNGEPYAIHGVNRHQDRRDQGWAISVADHQQDLRLMTEMGVTAIRLAHYPQSEYFHSLCDQSGMLLWDEIPQVEQLRLTPEFRANADQQLREMILQHYNHPSVAFWGLFNELIKQTYGTSGVPDLEALRATVKQLDPLRILVGVTASTNAGYNQVPDTMGFNSYPGWYGGQPSNIPTLMAAFSQELGGKRVAMSEYGAGGNPAQHQEGPIVPIKQGGQWHPEEYQTYLHEKDYEQLLKTPQLWGTFVWVMFDFGSDRRNEGGTPGVNDKGLVTADRKIKKDAYFFYQANWIQQPMVAIASRRMTPRKLATTSVEVFSNCPEVELKVNGVSMGVAKPDNVHVFRWENVGLKPGTNEIEALGTAGKKKVRDKCERVLASPSP